MFKHWSEEKRSQNSGLAEPWKSKQKMSSASLPEGINHFPHSWKKKKNLLIMSQKKFVLMFVISVNSVI